MLDRNDANDVGDCGTSDGEGKGYECIVAFQDGMKEVDSKHLCFDAHEIESGVEIDDLNAVVCEVKDVSSKSTLFGALPGWSPPNPPDDWNPTIHVDRGEPLFEDVDRLDWAKKVSLAAICLVAGSASFGLREN